MNKQLNGVLFPYSLRVADSSLFMYAIEPRNVYLLNEKSRGTIL